MSTPALAPTLDAALATLDRLCPDARSGLPEPLFLTVSRLTPLINVDLLVRDDAGRTLMTWRADRFHGPGWHVPGGIIRFKEPATQRIQAVAAQELGAQVTHAPAPLTVLELTHPSRDVRGHFISLVYECRLLHGPDPARQAPTEGTPHAGQWAWFDALPANTIAVHQIYRPLFGRRTPLEGSPHHGN